MSKQPSPQKPSRLTALLLTLGVSGAAAHDELIDGQISAHMAIMLIVLIFFWSGRLGDRLLTVLLNRFLK